MQPEALINSYIVETDSAQRQNYAVQLSKCPLIQVIKCLEDPLTQEDSLVRATATQCLADFIKHKKDMNPSEIKVLSIFLGDRLQDQNSTEAAAEGLLALLHKSSYEKADVTAELLGRFKEIDMLQADVSTRYQIYQFLRELSRDPSDEFISTFVSVASGEKDPRNLMISLQISHAILSTRGDTLPKEKRAELYDITFCYFPVKFHPPKDMPYKITAEEIKQRLSETLSSPALAEWAIPGLISKLTAVSVTVKTDTLSALGAAIDKLNAAGELGSYWKPVWEGIKFEVLHGTPESETYAPVLKILAKFVGIPEFLDEVLKEFEPESIPNSKLSQLCYVVIGISTSEEVWNRLAPVAIEKCLGQHNILILFLSSPYDVPHLDQVFQSLLTAHANGDKRDAVLGIKKVALSKNGQEYVSLIVQILTSEKEYAALAELAAKHPMAIQEHCLPQLLSEFPSPQALEALAKICCVRPLIHTLTVRLVSRIDLRDPKLSLLLLNTLIESSSHMKTNEDLLGYNRVLTQPLLTLFANTDRYSDRVVEAACVLLERGSRGVTVDQQLAYRNLVLQYLDKIHFHLVFSSLVAMKSFPYEDGFIFKTLPKLYKSANILERAAYLRLLAGAVNRWPDQQAAFPKPLVEFNAELTKALDNESPHDLEVFTWVTKGLLLRNDNLGFQNAQILTAMAKKNILVARVYGVLLAPDRSLSKETGCTVRPLYRQRLFVSSLPALSSGESTEACLLAVSSLLKYSPQPVVKSHFERILPLLLSSLETKSESLQVTAILTITSSLPECAPSISPELETIVPVLVKIGTTAKLAAARAAAFKGLCALREALPEQTNGFRDMIKEKLQDSVGDFNREVRKYAVKCRQMQF